MELSDYLRVVRRRWVSILLIMLTCVGASAAYTFLQTPEYEARSRLFVSVGAGSDTASEVVQGNSFAEKRVASYVALATSQRVLSGVAEELGLDPSGSEIQGSVSASSPPETVLIDVSATHANPELAADIANASARKLKQAVSQVENVSLARLSLFQEATVPTTPASPLVLVNLGLGAVLGLLIGFAFAVLRETLDTRLRSEEDVERITQVGVLGSFASESGLEKRPLITQGDPYSPRAESFRQLRTHLHFTNIDGGSQSIVVSSSIPGEGKSSTAVNLAIMLAESGSRVLLVDADLRRPRVAKYLGLESVVGLTTVLTHQISMEEAIQTWGPGGNLHVLTSGQLAPNPSELLGSPGMEKLIALMEQQYEVVVIDAPPMLPVTDPAVLGAASSGIMLVVSVDGSTHRGELKQAIQNIDSVNARLMGIVVNKMAYSRSNYRYHDYKPEAPIEISRREKKALSGMRHL